MTVVVTGGGSGGHITPILAVAEQLKRIQPDVRIVYIGQKGDKLSDIPSQHPAIDAVYAVRAGKLRRYYGAGWKQLLDISTQSKNLRDLFNVVVGLFQSFRLMRQLKPSMVFSRGGFVSVPVTLGGKLAGVPYVTHDSDSVPSLANRLIARWATKHLVALPAELYPYPLERTLTVGIPLGEQFELVTPHLQRQYRHELGLPLDGRVLLLTGGGNGAEPLNQALLASATILLKRYTDLTIITIAGRAGEAALNTAYDTLLKGADRQRVRIAGFVTDLYRYSGAADLVLARAGATTLAELAVQGKASLIVPASQLVGGHQTKNVTSFEKHGAVVVMTDDQIAQEQRMARTIIELLDDPARRKQLGDQFHTFGYANAAEQTARIILKVANKEKV